MDINPKLLLKKMNPSVRNTLERASGLCSLRTHYNVEIEHYLTKLLDMGGGDFEMIRRHFGIDGPQLAADLLKSLDALKSGSGRAPSHSVALERLLLEAWTVGSLVFAQTKIRSGIIILALVTDAQLAHMARRISPELGKINMRTLHEGFAAVVAGSTEDSAATDNLTISLIAENAELVAENKRLDELVNQWDEWKEKNWDEDARMTKNAVEELRQKDAELEAALREKDEEVEALQADLLAQIRADSRQSYEVGRGAMRARKCQLCGGLTPEREMADRPGYFDFQHSCCSCGKWADEKNSEIVSVPGETDFKITPALLSSLFKGVSLKFSPAGIEPLKVEVVAKREPPRKLHRSQKIAAWTGACCLLGAMFFPPWARLYQGGMKQFLGFSWLFQPPGEGWIAVDSAQLIVEGLVVIVTTLAVVFLLGQTEKKA